MSEMEYDPPDVLKHPLQVPEKILMGPGPSNPSARVRAALTMPILGQMHPETFAIMDEIKEGVRYMFQTKNEVTMCISGAGHSGMEASLCNTLEDGDIILLGVTGIWGERATDMARRYGADVRILQARPGEIITLEDLEAYMEIHRPRVFFITHGDSSTGVLQPLEGMGDICRKYKCLFIVDTVASLGGTPFYADKLKVDVVYTGSQKVLGAPPGITPISFSDRAIKRIKDRHNKIKVYYWDVFALGDYWGCFGKPRFYHHSICTPLLYALREALAQACDQKLGPLIRRHMDCSYRLQCGLEDMGLEMFVGNPQSRLPTVNTIKVPKGVDWMQVAAYALKHYNLEISGGLGPTAGVVFRVGLMGEGATVERVDLVLKAMREALENASGFKPKL